jgi:polyhydroxyalkanoate synthesis repressor PhaR
MAEHQSAVIKKYSDRRLYHSSARRYVNLGEIARLIREGIDVKVVDARTGKDLTRAVLTQIIVEDSRGGGGGLPMQLLRQLIVASDRASHELVSTYLEGAMDLYRKAESAVRDRVLGPKAAFPGPVGLVRQLLGTETAATDKGRDDEIEELRRRLSQLEAGLARKRRPKSRRSPSRASS